MSSNVTHAKEPLFRMVKRDAIPQKKAWMIRAAAFLLSLATGAVVIMMLGHNPFSVYISMIKGAWGTKTVSYETIKIAIPLLITSIGISFAFKMKFWNIGAEGQILVGAVAAGAFGLFTAHIFPKIPLRLADSREQTVQTARYDRRQHHKNYKWDLRKNMRRCLH